jgi:uncharacterized protein (DUF433 family)
MPTVHRFSNPGSQLSALNTAAPWRGSITRILEKGAQTMATATLDWSQCPAVESIPGKVSGAWVFRGTRMPVQTVFENLEAGMSVDEITEVFDVTPEEVRAVLHFASQSLAKAPVFGW